MAHTLRSLQALAAAKLSIRTLTSANLILPHDLVRNRAAETIQAAYRATKASRKQRLLAEVSKSGLLKDKWELTEWMNTGMARGWITLQKWTFVDRDFNKDFIYTSMHYTFNKVTQCLVIDTK
jgi:hypothetical protein